jgi:hypothetical protein
LVTVVIIPLRCRCDGTIGTRQAILQLGGVSNCALKSDVTRDRDYSFTQPHAQPLDETSSGLLVIIRDAELFTHGSKAFNKVHHSFFWSLPHTVVLGHKLFLRFTEPGQEVFLEQSPGSELSLVGPLPPAGSLTHTSHCKEQQGFMRKVVKSGDVLNAADPVKSLLFIWIASEQWDCIENTCWDGVEASQGSMQRNLLLHGVCKVTKVRSQPREPGVVSTKVSSSARRGCNTEIWHCKGAGLLRRSLNKGDPCILLSNNLVVHCSNGGVGDEGRVDDLRERGVANLKWLGSLERQSQGVRE